MEENNKLPITKSPFQPIRENLTRFEPLKLVAIQDKMLNNDEMIKQFLLVALGLVLVIFVSAITSYFITQSQANIRFVSEPRPDNPDYGYLQINGKSYYQLYTTTEVKDDTVPPGSHYHRIDLRGEK